MSRFLEGKERSGYCYVDQSSYSNVLVPRFCFVVVVPKKKFLTESDCVLDEGRGVHCCLYGLAMSSTLTQENEPL